MCLGNFGSSASFHENWRVVCPSPDMFIRDCFWIFWCPQKYVLLIHSSVNHLIYRIQGCYIMNKAAHLFPCQLVTHEPLTHSKGVLQNCHLVCCNFISWGSIYDNMEGKASSHSFRSCNIWWNSFQPLPCFLISVLSCNFFHWFMKAVCWFCNALCGSWVTCMPVCANKEHVLWWSRSFCHKNEMWTGYHAVCNETFKEWMEHDTTVSGCSFTMTRVIAFDHLQCRDNDFIAEGMRSVARGSFCTMFKRISFFSGLSMEITLLKKKYFTFLLLIFIKKQLSSLEVMNGTSSFQ